MRFTLLGSGSSGNATLIVTDRAAILIDCGFSARETARLMREAGFDPTRLDAVLITHEHGDHIGGMPVLSRQLGVTVHIADQTRHAGRLTEKDHATVNWGEPLRAGHQIEIGDAKITPVSVPHDAADPLLFTVEAGGVKMAVVTDLGYIPAHVAKRLEGCHGLVLEANHDREMLRNGPYSWDLKQRIASRRGHLANDQTAEFLSEHFDGKAEWVVLAHLSQQNNHPEIARFSALDALQQRHPLFAHHWEERVLVAPPKGPMDWIRLE